MEATRQAERIRAWLHDDLKYHLRGDNAEVPTTSDLRKLCRGNMVEIWDFMTSRVQSEQQARHIRQNVQVFGLSGSGRSAEAKRVEDLRARRDALRAQLNDTHAGIRQVESETIQLRKAVLDAEQASKMASGHIRGLKERQVVGQAAVAHTEGLTHVVGEYARRVDQQTERYAALGRDETDSGATTYFEVPGTVRELETGHQRTLRQLTASVTDSLIEALRLSENDPDSPTDPDALASELLHGTQAIANRVANALAQAGLKPADLVEALSYLTASTSTRLRQTTKDLNLREDALQLRFHIDDRHGSELIDATRPRNPLDTVGSILRQRQQAHVDMFMETERLKNVTAELGRTIDKLKGVRSKEDQYTAVQNARLGNSTSPVTSENAITLVRQLQSLELEYAEVVAAHAEASRLQSELSHTYHTGRKSMADARHKMRKITSYARRQDDKAQLCRNLIKENMKLRQTFVIKQQAIKEFVGDRISPLRESIQTLVASCSSRLKAEALRFSSLSLNRVRYATGVDAAVRPLVKDLNINRLVENAAGAHVVTELGNALGWSLWKAPEDLLPEIVRRQNDARRLIARLGREKQVGEQMLDSLSSLLEWNHDARIEDLLKSVAEQDKDILDKTIPDLEQNVKLANVSVEATGRIREIASDWWNQPAQYLLPDKKVDGMNVQEWLAKWRDLTSQLHRHDAAAAAAH